MEIRFVPTTLRALSPAEISSGSPGSLEGYSALWSHPGKKQNFSGDLGGFFERLAPDSLYAPKDVYALWNHSSSHPLARTGNSTLKLRSDSTGLHSTILLPDTSYARDLHASVARGDVAGQSFGFQCEDDDWDDCDPSELDPNDYDASSNGGQRVRVRTVKRAKLLEISPCTLPAYGGTGIGVSGSPSIMGRSFDALFPDGVPNEIRARIPNARSLFEQSRDRRRRLTDRVLAL